MPLGVDVLEVSRGIWRAGVGGHTVAALEIALRVLLGLAADQPVCNPWDAIADRLPAHGSGEWVNYTVPGLAAEMQRCITMRCEHDKMKIHLLDPQVNRGWLKGIRRAIEDSAQLIVDATQRLDVPSGKIRQVPGLGDLSLV